MKTTYYRYRPERVDDGQGGYDEVLGVPVAFYGNMIINKAVISIDEVFVNEDIDVDDVISIREVKY